MEKINLKSLVEKINVRVNRPIPQDVVLERISTDTREETENSLFIALSGPNFNGHDFVADAVTGGAVAILVSENVNAPDGVFVLKTDDVTRTMMEIVKYYKQQIGILIVAITGSTGKTSTKDMVASVLDQKYKIIKTKANLNNEIGVFKTVLCANACDELAVVEVAMSGPGEIREISLGLQPEIAMITNIGLGHLEFLKNQDNIFKAKMEITEGMKSGATLILNADDKYLKQVALPGEDEDTKCICPAILSKLKDFKLKTCAIFNTQADVIAENIEPLGLEGANVTFFAKEKSQKFFVPAAGEHNVRNSIMAYCVGKELNLTDDQIAAGFRNFVGSAARQRVVKHNECTYVLDYYNANPDSMVAAISTLAELAWVGEKIFVLGDMKELGEKAQREHEKVGESVASGCLDWFFCVGDLASFAARAANEAGMKQAVWFESEKKLAESLQKVAKKDSVVWIKGSRAMNLEEVVQAIGVEVEKL